MVFSRSNESLSPLIRGFYYGNFAAETIKRSNINAIGGEFFMNLWFFRKSQFSIIIGSKLSVVNMNIPQNPLVDEIGTRYIVGIGGNTASIDDSSSRQSGFLTMSFSAKLAYKILSGKTK